MFEKLILAFNVVVMLAGVGLAATGLWFVIDGQLLAGVGYYLAAMLSRVAWVDMPTGDAQPR